MEDGRCPYCGANVPTRDMGWPCERCLRGADFDYEGSDD